MTNDKIENFLDGIEMTKTDWDSIDTSKIPNDCDKTPLDIEFESFMTDIPDDVERILDVVDIVEKNIKSRAKELNEAVFNTMKEKAPYLVKLDDDVVYDNIIDSTIRYKNSHHLNDLYSLYRRLSDKDIRKFCYTEIHSMYAYQIRKSIRLNNKLNNKAKKATRNQRIFDCIDAGMRYAEIAAKFNLSEISIKKLAQKHKKDKESNCV